MKNFGVIAENLPEPLIVLENNKISWVNFAAETWLKQSNETLKGQILLNVSPDFDVLCENMSKSGDMSETIQGYDMAIRLRGKREFICSYLVFPCPPGQAILIRPKQTGRSTSSQQPRSEAVTMLGRMLAHELKNPLAGIRGAAQLLEADSQNPDDLELTNLIKTEVDRIGRLADRMETFGATDSGHYQAFNVHTILRKATLLFQSQDHAGVKIVEFYDPSLPSVFGDADALMQVVVNLVANAIEAIKSTHGENGVGVVEIQTLYQAGVRRRRENGQSYNLPIVVRIIDNGPGIDADIRERIFHPFVTGKANGHGLGLALVSKIIAEHGGIVDLETQPGRTIFSILLPTDRHINSKI